MTFPRKANMKTRIRIVKKGADHVELQVDSESAAALVADEANSKDIKPVIGQRQGLEDTEKHYVVLNGVVTDLLNFLEQNPNFQVVSG